MAKKTSRGRKQDRARVAGGQDYEVRYEAKKKKKSVGAVKRAVKKVGNSRKKVERRSAVKPSRYPSARAAADGAPAARDFASLSLGASMVR